MAALARSDAPLGDVCVLGLGVSGRDLCRYLAGQRDAGRVGGLCAVGGAPAGDGSVVDELRALGVEVVEASRVEGSFDLAVASPGIAPHTELFQSALAASAELVGEPEFAWRESPERWVVITGTNGKTTTTSLTAHLLEDAGVGAEAVGNIGQSLSAALPDRLDQWFVAELSSYQLATTSRLHPRAAVLLNISPDHLAWHRTHEAYCAAKARAFANLGPSDLAVIGIDDRDSAAIAASLRARGLSPLEISLTAEPDAENAAWVADGELMLRLAGHERPLARTRDLILQGAHNHQNALAAASVASFVGVADDAIARGLADFEPLEHRIEPVAVVDGVSYVNDSKATNTDATEKALVSYPAGRIVVLLGGSDKGTDLTRLADLVAERAKAAVCYGEAGPRLAAALRASGAPRVLEAPAMAEALEAARGVAEPGDVVLLSPACASFDEFRGFEARGRAFKGLVRAMGSRP